MPPHKHAPLPLMIGITGHRDIREEDIPHIESRLREFFEDLRKRYPATPLVLLTSLAEGADRIGAHIALHAGVRLVVPLPMEKKLFEADFNSASLKEFHDLLARADHWFELPLVGKATTSDIREHGKERDLQYAQGGAYIVSHCQILVALWDGVRRDLIGGTSRVVRYKLDGVPNIFAPPQSPLDVPECGPVFHILTPRASNHSTEGGAPFSTHLLFPTEYDTRSAARHAYEDIYAWMNRFNHDALRLERSLGNERKRSKESVMGREHHSRLPASVQFTFDLFSIADTTSQHYQRRTVFVHRAILAMVFCAGLSLHLYTFVFTDNKFFLGLYLLAFVLAFLAHRWASKRNYQTKYEDYRALAEGLRVQFFWQVAHLQDSVADYYIRKLKSELDWIRDAIRVSITPRGLDKVSPVAPSRKQMSEGLTLVLNHWVNDQAKYFAHSAVRDHKKLHAHERWVTVFFSTGLALAIVQLFFAPSHLLLICVGLSPVVAALIHTHAQKNALSEHTKQYEWMSLLFARAKQHLQKLLEEEKLEEAQEFVGELGREALVENSDWILTYRERPLEVPKG